MADHVYRKCSSSDDIVYGMIVTQPMHKGSVANQTYTPPTAKTYNEISGFPLVAELGGRYKANQPTWED